ncbi:MAG: DUF4956 domain-containing protein [Clostridia bacterium]|nr:DUF4956 domain-containing protein [Clostridia bacterium]
MTPATFFISIASAIVTGIILSFMCFFRTRSSKSFLIASALMPAAVAIVIAIVNGNLGAGIAIAGAFSLVRFRSAPGTAKEICIIFISMSSGLAFGMGYIAYGVLFSVVCGAILMLFEALKIWEKKPDQREKNIRITLPEDLDYTGVFDDIFEKYTERAELLRVKTINMGSMFRVYYNVKLKVGVKEKEFIDEIRIRNGNLEVSAERVDYRKNEL